MNQPQDLTPFRLLEPRGESTSASLLLTALDAPAVLAVFESCGQYGNGYGWEGVARSAVRNRAPELDGRFDYDPEAGMFVAYGTDIEALRALGAILSAAYADAALLRDLIESGDPDEFD